MQRLKKFITSKQVAELFGVDTQTIIRWARTGKLEHVKHPINNYTYLFDRNKMEDVLRKFHT